MRRLKTKPRRQPAVVAPPEHPVGWLLHAHPQSRNFQLMFSSGGVNGSIFFTADQAAQLARQITVDLKDLPRRAEVAKAMTGGVP